MVKISDVSFSISFHFSWIIFCSEDFWSFFALFIPFFLDHFLQFRFQTFNLAFHSCFSGSFSAVKISDFFIISFLFFWMIFHLQWRFHFFFCNFCHVFSGSFSAVKISDFLLSFHSCFSGWFSICSEDVIVSFAISVMFFCSHGAL